MSARRSTFGPVLLGGLVCGGITAYAATRTWVHAGGGSAGLRLNADLSGSDAAPLAAALGLVALAAWGVILVTRLRARRLAAILGALAALGVAAVVVGEFGSVHSLARQALAARGGLTVRTATREPAYFLCGIFALAQAGCFAAAVRLAPGWPSMSSKYDAPGARRDDERAQPERPPQTEQELWRALSEGRDPTAPPAP